MKSNKLQINAYLHCGKCLKELKELKLKVSPQQYSRTQVGFTKKGVQVWCFRHNLNICHIDFEGVKHLVDTTAKELA